VRGPLEQQQVVRDFAAAEWAAGEWTSRREQLLVGVVEPACRRRQARLGATGVEAVD
jgi:hypothetical protein